MIKFDNVTKKYGDFTAVKNLNIEINSGEVFGFLGPNGAGKTTSIKMTVGLLSPTQGQVTVNNIDVQKEPEKAKAFIGYIPDSPYIYDKLTAWEFMALVGGLFNMTEEQVVERSNHYFEIFNIGDWAHYRAEDYSHGMRQKVVLAASLIHEPEVIVIDEPMVGLDPQSQKVVKDVLREKAREGRTVFMSTHTLSIAEEICDRVGIINHGNLLMVERIDELRNKLGQGNLENLFIQLTSGKGE